MRMRRLLWLALMCGTLNDLKRVIKATEYQTAFDFLVLEILAMGVHSREHEKMAIWLKGQGAKYPATPKMKEWQERFDELGDIFSTEPGAGKKITKKQ